MKRRDLTDEDFFQLVTDIMRMFDGLTCEQVQHLIGTLAKCAVRCSRFDVESEDFVREVERSALAAAQKGGASNH